MASVGSSVTIGVVTVVHGHGSGVLTRMVGGGDTPHCLVHDSSGDLKPET